MYRLQARHKAQALSWRQVTQQTWPEWAAAESADCDEDAKVLKRTGSQQICQTIRQGIDAPAASGPRMHPTLARRHKVHEVKGGLAPFGGAQRCFRRLQRAQVGHPAGRTPGDKLIACCVSVERVRVAGGVAPVEAEATTTAARRDKVS
jgi:hypothetical protein